MPIKTFWVKCSCEITATKVRAYLPRRTLRNVDLHDLTGLKRGGELGLDVALNVRGGEDLWLRFPSTLAYKDFLQCLVLVKGTAFTYKYVHEIDEMISALPPGEESPLFQIK